MNNLIIKEGSLYKTNGDVVCVEKVLTHVGKFCLKGQRTRLIVFHYLKDPDEQCSSILETLGRWEELKEGWHE